MNTGVKISTNNKNIARTSAMWRLGNMLTQKASAKFDFILYSAIPAFANILKYPFQGMADIPFDAG